MTTFDSLLTTVSAAATPEARVDALLRELAERIKSTSNDQNVQRLARELRAASPQLAAALRASR